MNGPACDTSAGCITCGDVGIAMEVLAAHDGTAVCLDQQGERHEVAVDLVEPVGPGDRVLVHAGVAIA